MHGAARCDEPGARLRPATHDLAGQAPAGLQLILVGQHCCDCVVSTGQRK